MSKQRGKLFIVSGPAGTGKTTLVKKLTKELPFCEQSISYTSRFPRPHEKDGVDYHFISREAFLKKIKNDDFLEHAEVYSNYYGSDKKSVEEKLEEGVHLFLVIDTQGALEVMAKVDAVSIFISPPSIEELHQRLNNRGTESKEVIAERLEWSKRELSKAPQYKYQIINDVLSDAYTALRSIVIKEDHTQE